MTAKTITLYYKDGNPDGICKAQLHNWSSTAYKIPASKAKSLDNETFDVPGVYFLFGIDGNTLEQFVYIGISKQLKTRLLQHTVKADNFIWKEAVCFLSAINELGTSEIEFLENKFFNLATEAHRYEVKNHVNPAHIKNEDEELGWLNEFASCAQLVLSALGHYPLTPLEKELETTISREEKFTFAFKGHEAYLAIQDDGHYLLQGSYISETFSEKNIAAGIIKRRIECEQFIGEDRLLLKDLKFDSPSGASDFAAGNSTNGQIVWKDENGKSLKERNENNSQETKESP